MTNTDDLMRSMAAHFQETMLENLKRQNRAFDIARGIDPDNQPTILVEQPLDPDWLEARAAFADKWNAIVAEGIDAGYLEHVGCFECGGELSITDETTEYVEQPNPDYDAAKPNPYVLPAEQRFITIPRAQP